MRNTDPSKLDKYGYCFFDKAIPLEMLDCVVAEVETFPIDEWDPISHRYVGVHRGPDAGDRRILSARLPRTRGDIQYSEIMYHDVPSTTNLSNFILEIINKALDSKHVLYNFAHVAAQGHERQSVHRDMHKIPGGLRMLTVFYAENYDVDANDGINTSILPGSKAGLPQPWDPVPIDLRHGNFFVLYSDLIHAGGAVPLSLPSDWWRKVGFLGLATFPVTYQFTQGIHVPFWAFKKHPVESTKPRCSMEKCRKNPTDKCFVCGRTMQRPCGRTVPCSHDKHNKQNVTP